MLVSCDDPTVYCNGEYKLKANNQSEFEKNMEAHAHGTTIVLKAVSLVDDAKTQYNSCSIRVTVNMASTTLSKVLEDRSAVQPVPKTTLAETTHAASARPKLRLDSLGIEPKPRAKRRRRAQSFHPRVCGWVQGRSVRQGANNVLDTIRCRRPMDYNA